MPKSAKPKGPDLPSGIILPYDRIEQLQQTQPNAKLSYGWGYGDKSWYPHQRRVLTSLIDEVGMFGGVGGGKTATMMAWLISGNPHLPTEHPDGTPNLVNISYMHHPGFFALILRKNEKDLWQFQMKAQEMYAPYGIRYVNDRFVHPMGGTIVCGHMADQHAWTKYLGNEYVRIAIDEAPLIPDFELYQELMIRLRTPFPELRTQILLAGNYGGPGSGWVFDRFMNVKGPDGELVPHGTVIEEAIEHPITKKIHKRTRVWEFSNYKDNPKYALSDNYPLILASIKDPKKKAAYMEGQWNIFSGSFFEASFKPEIHVIKPVQLHPWFPRAIGMDWGFRHESAAYWICQHGVTQQHHIYRELVASQTYSEQFGFEIAKLSLAELNASSRKAMTLYLSHDAFQKRDDVHCTAELIARGMARVLGTGAVHAPELVIRQMQEAQMARGDMPTPAELKAREDAFDQIRKQRMAGITIRPAPRAGALGWQYLREMMRHEPIVADKLKYSQEMAMQLLMESEEKYQEYLAMFPSQPEEVLPKLQIWETCSKLIDAIPRLQFKKDQDNVDDKHFPGKDRCFVAGTMIATEHGERPIEGIQLGDLVWTRKGLRPVYACGSTGTLPVRLLKLSNGRNLVGTGNHPIWQENSFVALDSLCYAKPLWHRPLWLSMFTSRVVSIGDTLNRLGGILGFTFGMHQKVRSIGRFGSPITGLFQWACSFTTRMRTRLITTFPTWSVCLTNSTMMSTGMMNVPLGPESWQKWDVLSQKHGMHLLKAASGIGNTQSKLLKMPLSILVRAKYAVRRLLARFAGLPCAPTTAAPKIGGSRGSTMKRVFVSFVEWSSSAITMLANELAPVCVVQSYSLGHARVYNLSVAQTAEYFANGILVHNCDGWLYTCTGFRDERVEEPYESFRDRRLNEALAANPNLSGSDLVWINRGLEDEWASVDRDPISYTPPRGGRGRRMGSGVLQ